MANEEHLAILEQGVLAWNDWRNDNRHITPNLKDIDLAGADLSTANLTQAILFGAFLAEANLSMANLAEADLSWANLSGASLSEANLNGVDLTQANLIRANLNEADLREANLNHATLTHASLNQSELSGADLNSAIISQTSFIGVDISDVKGLETIIHWGRSFIDIHTFYKSKGSIPEVFLRGCGVPDVFIEYMGSLVGKAIEYYSCFISYSSKDQAIAERLYADLQTNGVRCWYAPHDLRIGDPHKKGIDEAIRFHDKLLLILSENAIESGWVEQEVERALEKEREIGEYGLFPIRIDDTVMEADSGWAAHIRKERHIGDFRDWKSHDAYQDVLQRLLRDLKTDQKAPTPAAVFSKPTDPEKEKLVTFIDGHFNEIELKDLYAYVTVEYNAVPGQTKSEKARELVAYFDRHRPGGAATLSDYLKAKRPNLFQ